VDVVGDVDEAVEDGLGTTGLGKSEYESATDRLAVMIRDFLVRSVTSS